MYKKNYTIQDRLQQIAESIDIIKARCQNIHTPDDFLISPDNMTIFDSCVMRLQTIGEQVGKLLKEKNSPLFEYNEIPWQAIYDMRNFISHEYANIDEVIIFSTIKEDLTVIKPIILKLLQQYSNENLHDQR